MRGFNFPYLKDADGAGGPQLPGGLHPHTVVLYSDLAIAYSRRIDDLRPGAAVRSRDLEAVLADIAAGRPVASRRRRRSAAASSGSPLVRFRRPRSQPDPAPTLPAKSEEYLFTSGWQERLLFSKEADTQRRTKSWQSRLFMNG
jgi:hypothetical protein